MLEQRWLAVPFVVIVLATLLSANRHTYAQAWKPDRQVEILIGTSAGGPRDHMGRVLQKILQDQRLLDVPSTVVNKPGGGGAVSLAYLNQHPGDGRYVMINAISILTDHITGKSKLAYTDFTPLAILGIEYVSVAVRIDSPIKSGRDLLERLRNNPNSMSVAIGTALGNSTHISLALAMRSAGVDVKKLRTVVFNSGGDSMIALLGGHVDIAASAPSSVMEQVKSGKLRLLAIGAPRRGSGELAGVPTWKELGVESTFGIWRGLAGPNGMSGAQIAFWDDVLVRSVKTEEWRKDLEQSQVENVYKNSRETRSYWKEQNDEARAILTELGLAK